MRSLVRRIEKSSDRFVVARREAAYVFGQQNYRT
jgi:hypothetical protein